MNKNKSWLIFFLGLVLGGSFIYFISNSQQNIVSNKPLPSSDSSNSIKQKTEEVDYIQTYIPKDSKSGSCWTTSIASANGKAWRCTVDNSIYDPCFEIDKNKLVCGIDPETTQGGFVLNLTKALPPREDLSTSDRFYWIVKLANGTKCWLITGTAGMVNGKLYYYTCDKDNAVIVGKLDKSTNPWSADVAYLKKNSEEALRTERTEILKVWK